MVDVFDGWPGHALPGDSAAPTADINPTTGKPNAIPRNNPEPIERRKRLVSTWVSKVKKAKRFWKPAFDRMREDQEFAFGKQWSKDAQDRRYVANLTLRLVAQKTAFLYAKNPKAVAKKRQRLNATSWDESQTTLTQLMQSGAMMMGQMQQQGAPPAWAARRWAPACRPGCGRRHDEYGRRRRPRDAADGNRPAAGHQSDDVRRHADAAPVDDAFTLDKLDIGADGGGARWTRWPAWAPARSPAKCNSRPALATN